MMVFANDSLMTPLRREAGERKGPIAQRWEGEVVSNQYRFPPHPASPPSGGEEYDRTKKSDHIPPR